MHALAPVRRASDVLSRYRGTPAERLLRFHDSGDPLPPSVGRAELLVGTCMDHPKDLTLPGESACVPRAAGGNLRDSELEVSYAVAVGRAVTLALPVAPLRYTVDDDRLAQVGQ